MESIAVPSPTLTVEAPAPAPAPAVTTAPLAQKKLPKDAPEQETTTKEVVTMEGYLFVRIHVRKRRYCVLQGRTLHVFNHAQDARKFLNPTKKGNSSSKAKSRIKKSIIVVGVKDPLEMEKHVRASICGNITSCYENALVVTSKKSRVLVVEAETPTEKQRWLHAMNCLNFTSSASERKLFEQILSQSTFDAHTAVT